jgi:hypothetical protein
MSTPDERAAEQIAGMAADTPQAVASEQEIADSLAAHAGTGVTEADLDAIKAQLASFAQQLAAQQAAQQDTASPDSVSGTLQTLAHHLEGHGDQTAIALAADAAKAAEAFTGGSGALSAVADAVEKVRGWLHRNPPYPGENFHYNSARSVADHLPVVIDRVGASSGS